MCKEYVLVQDIEFETPVQIMRFRASWSFEIPRESVAAMLFFVASFLKSCFFQRFTTN